MISHAESAKLRLETQRLMIKGYSISSILNILNSDREQKGQKPISNSTIFKWKKQIDDEGSREYLHLLKDKTAYIVLHRRKLLALELYRTMIHDKIAFQGGVSGVKPETLNKFIQTLLQITVTESRLEKEIPQLFSMGEAMRPEQIKDLENEIIAGLPKDLQEQLKKENSRRQQLLERALSEKGQLQANDLIDLDQFNKDTHFI